MSRPSDDPLRDHAHGRRPRPPREARSRGGLLRPRRGTAPRRSPRRERHRHARAPRPARPGGGPLRRRRRGALRPRAADPPRPRRPPLPPARRQRGARDRRAVERGLQRVVAAAARALGVDGEVRAELYKLLVYAAGDFFVEHRDTEKAPGMFATLVVALPSPHEGGALVIRHEGREARVDLSGDDLGVARWAAFYADCSHALEPVREGYRVALVYNLTRAAQGLPARPTPRTSWSTALTELLRAWADTPTRRRSSSPARAPLHPRRAGLRRAEERRRRGGAGPARAARARTASCASRSCRSPSRARRSPRGTATPVGTATATRTTRTRPRPTRW